MFVEGLEDVAFITAGLHLYGLWNEFHALGCNLVTANGKSHLVHPVAIASILEIPYFLIFDCDNNCNEKDRSKHEPDNKTLMKLTGFSDADAFPATGVDHGNCKAWATNMGDAIEADFDNTVLEGYKQTARTTCGNAKSLNKNSMFIAEWLTLAHENGKESSTLKSLCETIIKSAK